MWSNSSQVAERTPNVDHKVELQLEFATIKKNFDLSSESRVDLELGKLEKNPPTLQNKAPTLNSWAKQKFFKK